MSKAYRAEARIRSLGGKFGLSPENVRKIQVAAVQAVALYGAELWWDETKNHSRTTDLQTLVNRQSRSITGMLRTTPIGSLVKEAGLRSADSLLANRQRRYATRAFQLLHGNPIGDGVRHPLHPVSLFAKLSRCATQDTHPPFSGHLSSTEFIRHLITTFTLDVKTGNANLFQFTQQPQNNNYSKNYSQRTRTYFLLRLKKHTSISVTTTRELRTQRAYPGTHHDMSQSQDDNILDSITVAGSQPTPQAGSTAIQDVTNETTIEATNLNVEGGNAMKKKVGQTLAGGRPIRNKLGTLGGFKTNRTRIEVTTKPSDAMERNIDRLLTIFEELSNKCRAQEDQITDLNKYVSDARDEIITNQEEVYRCNQFRMTATDAAIREIKVLIETTSQTQAKKPTTVARSKDQGPRVEIVNNCITTQDNSLAAAVKLCSWVVCFFVFVFFFVFFFFFYVYFYFVCLFVRFLIVAFSFTQFVFGFLYFNVTSGALIPRRSTAHREGRRISFV
jgi:hypothetical protein